MITERPMLEAVNDNFERYAGNVILDRAICDARDMLKPSARMLIYSQLKVSKNTADKPFIKSARVVGDCLGRFYTHGDSSCYGAYMRMSKPFAMRYPLEDCQGNNGTIVMLDDEAAMRYTEVRLSGLAQSLYDGLDDKAINDWKDNFDETEKYPSVMPSIGYYNICNGTIGLGVGISSQIPQFNLREVNEALIKLIRNPEATDEEIIVLPDFATGATLMNPEEVRQALIAGRGKSCVLRAKMNYNPVDNSIRVYEIPYSIGTDTIREEIAKLLEKDENYGIDNISDKSGKTVDFTIYLKKGVSAKQMIAKLYKDTSLESTSPIGMWVLDKGRYPTIMGLRQLFNAYIAHCRETETNILTYKSAKLKERKNVIDGLLKANADIDNIVKLIRTANSAEEAKTQLAALGYNDDQIKAILAMRLSSLTKLDTAALSNEQVEITANITWHDEVLADSSKLDEEIIKKLEEVKNKFGDARRTTINDGKASTAEIEDKPLALILFDNNMMRAMDADALQPGTRGRKGAPIKPPRGATVKQTIYTSSSEVVYIFTDAGRMYTFSLADMMIDTDYSVYNFIELQNNNEKVVEIVGGKEAANQKWAVIITKNGLIKKTETAEYNARSRKGFIVIKLEDDDAVQKVFFSNSEEDKIMAASNLGYYVYYPHSEIMSSGRASKGCKVMRLTEGVYITDATLVKANETYRGILSISKNGKGKISALTEYPGTSRAARGNAVMRLEADDELAAIAAIPQEQTKVSFLNGKILSLNINSIAVQARNTKGCILINNRDGQNPIKIL